MTEPKPRTDGLITSVILLAALALFLFLHFRNPDIFRRELIDFDDQEYIKPLRTLSLAEYFGTWIRDAEHFAFPLRDMTFFLDFAFQKKTGITTVWATNALFFIATFGVLFQIFRDSLSHVRGLAVALILWLAFHPALIEMVQWASNRKHLMVGLFLSLASLRVLRLARAREYPSEKEWMAFFIAYIAAWLCWPSASLWIFAVLFIFRQKMSRDPRAVLRISTALVIGVGAIAWTYLSHQSFSGSTESTVGSAGIRRMPIFGLFALGRGTFSLFWPYFSEFAGQQPYYRLEHPAGFIGLAISAVVGALAFWRYRKLDIESRQPARDAFILAAALFLPQMTTVLTFVEFVWADRYLFLPMPYLALGLALLAFPPEILKFSRGKKVPKGIVAAPVWAGPRWVGIITIALFTFASVLVGARLVPRWSSGLALFNECSHTEKSPRCLALAVEQSFDRTGCRDLPPLFAKARQLSAEGSKPFEFTFRTQLPLYESICIAQSELPAAIKTEEFAGLYRTYESPQYAVFGEVLALLRTGDFPAAFGRANSSYLGTEFGFADLFPKAGNLLRAQASALCELAKLRGEEKKSDDCRLRAAILGQLTANARENTAQFQWAFNQSIEAFNEGKKVKRVR